MDNLAISQENVMEPGNTVFVPSTDILPSASRPDQWKQIIASSLWVAKELGLQDHDARDVAQTVALRICELSPADLAIKFPNGIPINWVKTVTNRLCIDLFRKQKRKRAVGYDIEQVEMEVENNITDGDVEQAVNCAGDEYSHQRTIQKVAVEYALGALSPVDKKILMCSLKNEGDWTKEIASELGMTANHLRVRRSRILARVKDLAQRWCDNSEQNG